jgi:membrane-bound inhibitor of C-type lysozyme
MNKLLCTLLLIGMSSMPAFAQSTASAGTAKKEAVKKPVKKTAKKAAPAAAAGGALVADENEEDLGEPNIEGSTVTDYQCELGNKITTYNNEADEKYMAIRWKNSLHRLRRVGTSTGANRFENRKYGLVWISIPSKAMLLDSRKGQQLANECRNAEQQKAFAAKRG